MGTIFTPKCGTRTMSYVEIKLYREIENRFNITKKYDFMENSKQYLDGCEILLNTDKKNHLYY